MANMIAAFFGRAGLKEWYDGYPTKAGELMYNPRSVVAALTNNNPGNYWTSSGPYDEIFYYIKNNIDDVRDPLALMVAGEPTPARVRAHARRHARRRHSRHGRNPRRRHFLRQENKKHQCKTEILI